MASNETKNACPSYFDSNHSDSPATSWPSRPRRVAVRPAPRCSRALRRLAHGSRRSLTSFCASDDRVNPRIVQPVSRAGEDAPHVLLLACQNPLISSSSILCSPANEGWSRSTVVVPRRASLSRPQQCPCCRRCSPRRCNRPRRCGRGRRGRTATATGLRYKPPS